MATNTLFTAKAGCKFKQNLLKNKIGFKNKAKAIILGFMAFMSICLPFFAKADLCDSISSSTGGFFSCGTEVTSFTQFSGTLSTPDASQYAPGLSQNQDLRAYIKNVVNFGLGFLGLIAVVVVIYGGFMYVTAAGNEEQAGKGKKAITYSVIGILIILSSFALVNTVLLAGGGTDQNATNGAATGGANGSSNAQRQALFNYAGSVVQTIARNFVTAYQNYSETQTDLVTLDDTSSMSQIIQVADAQGFKTYLQQKRTILTNMITRAGAISQIAEQGQKDLNVIDLYINLSNQGLDQAANAASSPGSQVLATWFGANVDYSKIKADFDAAFGNSTTATPTSGGAAVSTKNPSLALANSMDFAQAIAKANHDLYNLYNQIHTAGISSDVNTAFKNVNADFLGLVAGIDKIPESSTAFLPRSFLFIPRAFAQAQAISAALALKSPSSVNNQSILKIVNDLSDLYEKVKNLQFVYTVITVDTTDGNAPLLVNVDGLKSLDPYNQSIPATSYHWDFGNGSKGDGPTQSAVFNTPGTYIIKLTIDAPAAPTGLAATASGVAYQTITVHPPTSKIGLDANVQGEPAFHLSKYDGTERTIDEDTLPVTVNQAKAGINFDASSTKIGTGTEAKPLAGAQSPAKVHWDFGDKSDKNNVIDGVPNDNNVKNPKKTYQVAGNYPVLLEVTDEQGITDRKITNVVVSPIIARIDVSPTNAGQITQEFTFDGSGSASDASQIKTFTWKITDSSGQDVSGVNPGNVDSFKYTFKNPGTYAATLTVNDGANDSTPFSTTVKITSKPPVAQFTTLNTDPTHPNLYVMDGTGSYDPDGAPDEKLQYKWEVNSAPGDCTYYKLAADGKTFDMATPNDCTNLLNEGATTDNGFSDANVRLKFKFKKGKYNVTLDVQDPNDKGNSVPQETPIVVDNDLDVGWGDDGKPLTKQLANGTASVTFNIASENGVSYEIDAGDGKKENGDIVNGAATATHQYTQAGAFKVKLTVYDSQDNGNATYRKVFIGSSNATIAAISVNLDGDDISNTSDPIVGNRKSIFTFDGSKSINVDGSGRNLNYSWDFGDGTTPESKKIDTHTFKDIGDSATKNFTVTLTVTDADDATIPASKDTVTITIKRLPPVVTGLSAIPANSTLVTPVQVNVSAQGAVDPDGKINTFKWWYYDVTDPNTQLGVQITQTPSTTLTIGTNGEEGQKKTYKFGVIATDNENDKFDSSQSLNDSLIPSLDVTNGPNKAPIAKFNVDHTSINVGDSVNFSSSSSDPDKTGSIVSYMWNFEGKGYTDPGDKTYDKANVAYTFNTPNKDGFKVRLKVRDNNGAESVSDPVTVYVDSKANPPTAAFSSKQLDGKKIQFINNSTPDAANGAKLKTNAWDFDVATDANGDGIKDNDVQSTDPAPTFEYPDYGVYRAKLTVTDDQGNTGGVINFVNVKAPVVAQTQQTSTVPLEARLLTTPAPTVADGRVHLQGDSANVTLDFSTSTGNIKSYIIDKNVLFDSNGNGIKDDDEDYKTDKPGVWTTPFLRSYGPVRVRLTVVDNTGKKATVDKDIVFDAPPAPASAPAGTTTPSSPTNSSGQTKNQLSAFVLAGYEVVDWQLLLVSMLGFGIFIASTLNKKKHARNKSK